MLKPVVEYDPNPWDVIVVGRNGYLASAPIGHPSPWVSGLRPVNTSRVLKKQDDGSFETSNTKYVPKGTDKFHSVLANHVVL